MNPEDAEDPPEQPEADEIIEADASSSEDDFDESVVVQYPEAEHNFHTDEVFCVDVRADTIVSGGADHKAVVFAGEAVEIEHHSDSVIFAGFSVCGKYLALGSMDTKVSVWATGEWSAPLVEFDGPEGEVTWMCWHPRGPVLAAGSGDGSNWIWDVKAQSLLAVLHGHEISSSCGVFSPNGRYVCSGGKGVRVWDLKQMANGQAPCVSSFPAADAESTVISITMREDNALIVAGHSNGTVQGLSVTQPQALFQLPLFEDSVESVGICPAMPWLAAGCLVGGIKIVDVSTASIRCTAVTPGVSKLQWRQGVLFAGHLDGTVRQYEGSSLHLQKVFKSSQSPALDFAISADKVVKSGEDGKVFVFTLAQEE